MSSPPPNAPPTAEFLASVVEDSDDAIITKDLNGRVTSWNKSAERIFGYTAAEMIGNPISILAAPDRIDEMPDILRRVTQGERIDHYQTLRKAKDGRILHISLTVSPVRDAAGHIIGASKIARDITEQVRAAETEQQLIAFRDLVVSVTDNMPAAVTRCSRDFRYVWVSSAYASWLRRSKDQIEGHSIRDIIGEQGFEDIRPYMERVLTGERVEYTTRVNFFGPGSRCIRAIYVPTRSQGQVDGWIAVVTDITETVRYEEQLREANAELARANADLNQFAFAASHDLQQPLRMITSYSQLLLKGYRGQLDGQAETCVQWITEGTRRMRDLLADLLAYTQVTGGGQEAVEQVDLNLVLRETLENCRAAIQETEASVTSDPLPVVPGHNPHFVQLFQNLIGNALKYRSERPPRIHVSAVKEGGIWRLGVADNGIGIDPQYHPKIFGVFKRLHGSTIPGTGIGLAICQRVVERNGGRIWVESHEGQGATFYFTLPAVKASVAHGT